MAEWLKTAIFRILLLWLFWMIGGAACYLCAETVIVDETTNPPTVYKLADFNLKPGEVLLSVNGKPVRYISKPKQVKPPAPKTTPKPLFYYPKCLGNT